MNCLLKTILIIITVTIVSLICALRYNKEVPKKYLLLHTNVDRIPSIVHFVVGQIDEKDVEHTFQLPTPFSFVNYLTFLAARRHLRPNKLLVHFYKEPNTFWWNLAKQDTEIDFTLVKSRLVTEIFGRPVHHHSHRSDILRLEILLAYGGIYLDIDVLTFRSFQPLLNLSDVVMGFEDNTGETIGSAVLVAKKNAKFLERIYHGYQSYDRRCYRCNSDEIPAKLARIYTKEARVLPPEAFFVPDWNEPESFFESNNYTFKSNYASHLWNSFNVRRLSALSPDIILNGNFTLARMFRHAIGKSTLHKLKRFYTKHSSY